MYDPNLSGFPLLIEKPRPHFFSNPPRPFLASTSNREAIEKIKRGTNFCFEGTYGTAMAFYSWVKKQVNTIYPISDYQSSRINRDKLREFSQRLFVKIKNQSVDLSKAPDINWLKEFYSDIDEFYLPFAEVLGMNGAWQWWVNGIQFPGLEHKVHPFYGVYFPTRFEHLQLFDQWLSQNKPVSSAMDLGTGCGVLTFYMLKHGVKNILATDINPNSLYSVSKELERLKGEKIVRLKQASFFEDIDTKELDLVVFNPPWIPEKPSNSLDLAMYYQPDYFQFFFQQAFSALPNGCRLVMLYSTFAQVAGVEMVHPIQHEINSNKRFKLVQRIVNPVSQISTSQKSWLAHIRQHEGVELWELIKQV